jgi:hypothetical protein
MKWRLFFCPVSHREMQRIRLHQFLHEEKQGESGTQESSQMDGLTTASDQKEQAVRSFYTASGETAFV